MEFKGTKGEWIAVGKNVKINGELISRKTYPQGACVTTMELNLQRIFADAKLIASAPDLLEALQNIKKLCDGNITNENNIWHIANKAIEKALL